MLPAVIPPRRMERSGIPPNGGTGSTVHGQPRTIEIYLEAMKTNEAETDPELANQEAAEEAAKMADAEPPPPPRVPLPHERFTVSIHSADDASQEPRVPGEAVITVHAREGLIGTLYGASDLTNDERKATETFLAMITQKIERGGGKLR